VLWTKHVPAFQKSSFILKPAAILNMALEKALFFVSQVPTGEV
jgi:hypothetical protein